MLASADAASAAGVTYVLGDLEATLAAEFSHSVRATNAAMRDLSFFPVRETKDALQAIIIARNAADKKIEIKLVSTGDKATRVKIRVGAFGDEAQSRAILDKIKANL
jgi:hypothetical protein